MLVLRGRAPHLSYSCCIVRMPPTPYSSSSSSSSSSSRLFFFLSFFPFCRAFFSMERWWWFTPDDDDDVDDDHAETRKNEKRFLSLWIGSIGSDRILALLFPLSSQSLPRSSSRDRLVPSLSLSLSSFAVSSSIIFDETPARLMRYIFLSHRVKIAKKKGCWFVFERNAFFLFVWQNDFFELAGFFFSLFFRSNRSFRRHFL